MSCKTSKLQNFKTNFFKTSEKKLQQNNCTLSILPTPTASKTLSSLALSLSLARALSRSTVETSRTQQSRRAVACLGLLLLPPSSSVSSSSFFCFVLLFFWRFPSREESATTRKIEETVSLLVGQVLVSGLPCVALHACTRYALLGEVISRVKPEASFSQQHPG